MKGEKIIKLFSHLNFLSIFSFAIMKPDNKVLLPNCTKAVFAWVYTVVYD